MKRKIVALVLFLFLFNINRVQAIEDPRSVTNNRFGIHIIDENDLNLAAELVNSSGGQWGYVTIVIREDDRNLEKWQTTFDRLRELKLIPLIRLATKTENQNWAKPRDEDIESWVSFLGQLNWVIKNRYIILFNEPNHANEWGGRVEPEEYARFARLFQQSLKEKSQDFFILPAGFDASAPNSPTTMDMYQYFNRMYESDPEIFSLFDGWTSHSYPNPNFSGLPQDQGKTSIRSFKWETEMLSKLGLKRWLPIFITETGWKHQEGKTNDPSAYEAEIIAQFYKRAFERTWSNSQIVAVTPFVLRYLDDPFDNFSWIKPDSQTVYPQYDVVKNLFKLTGTPVQVHSNKLLKHNLPEKLVIESKYKFTVSFQNTGQSIWNKDEFKLNVITTFPKESLQLSEIPITKPFETANIDLKLQTPEDLKEHSLKLQLMRRNQQFGDILEVQINLIPPPKLFVKAKIWFKKLSSANDLSLLIYDHEDLVKKIQPFLLSNGEGSVDKLYNVIPQKQYRFVLVKPFYLPRQETTYLSEEETTVTFKRLLPIDFNSDGALTSKDIIAAIKNPERTISLLFPW